MRTLFYPRIASQIVDIVKAYEPLGIGLNELHRKSRLRSRKTCRTYILKLTDQNIVEISNNQRFYHITETAREQNRLEILEIKDPHERRKKKESKQERLKQLYQYLLILCANKRNIVSINARSNLDSRGVSILDVLNIPQLAFPYGYIRFSERITRKALRLLRKERVMESTEYADDTRFDIADNRLKECVQCLWELYEKLSILKMNIRYKHNFDIRWISAVRDWYERLWGPDYTNSEFGTFRNAFSIIKNAKERASYRAHMGPKMCISIANAISGRIKEIKEEYEDAFNKYPALVGSILDEVVYPTCIREDGVPPVSNVPKLLWIKEKL